MNVHYAKVKVVREDDTLAPLTVEDDGQKSEQVRSRLEGWDSDALLWRRVKVDANGQLTTGFSGTVDITEPVTVDGTVGITGTVPVSGTFWQSTQPVSGTVTADPTRPSTATSANVTGTGASVVLAAANAARKLLTVFNDSGVVAYVKLGTAASATSFTVKMVDQAYYELPAPVYTGAVEALWASGSVRVTEA